MAAGDRIRADGQLGDPRRDEGCDLPFAIDAQHDARQGDADLAGGDIVVQLVRILQHRQQGSGQSVAFFGHLDNARLASADQREFAGHVQPVEKDHQRYDKCDRQDSQNHGVSGFLLSIARSRGTVATAVTHSGTRQVPTAASCPVNHKCFVLSIFMRCGEG